MPLDQLAVADEPDGLVRAHGARDDAADREAARVVVVVEVADEDLERACRVAAGRRDLLEDHLEERRERLRVVLELALGDARAADRVERREIGLLVGRVEIAEEVEDLVEHLLRARVAAVDLVDDHDDREAELEALSEDEARLRQRALGRVDEEERAVRHEQRALDLAAEVGVARGVDDVDLHVLVTNARVLREDRDPALALEIVRVHHAFGDDLVFAERARLAKHVVDQRGLAVVDVRHDGDVSKCSHGP